MPQKTFDKYIGVKPVSTRKGYCQIKLNLKPSHLNHGGIAHGGLLATLCDIALAGAVSTLLKKEEWCVTCELSVKFMNPAFIKRPIFSYGQVVKKGNTLAFVEGGIKTNNGVQIARAHGIWVIKSRPSKKIKAGKRLD